MSLATVHYAQSKYKYDHKIRTFLLLFVCQRQKLCYQYHSFREENGSLTGER